MRPHTFFRTKFKKVVVGFTVVSTVFLFIYAILSMQENQAQPYAVENKLHSGSKHDDERELQIKYVVDTSSCKIPEMDPRDKSIKKFLQPDGGYPYNCPEVNARQWTYIDGTALALNETDVIQSGFSMASIHCCYRIITRVEQPISSFDKNADNYAEYSSKCYPIQNGRVQIDTEFIRVQCISKAFPLLNDVVYRDFFAVPLASSDRLISRKLLKWRRKKAEQSPPNVVIIGIDNNSRMNTHRHLTQTVEVLRRLGAVEMMGYTKVGENTFPNTVPFLTGHADKELGNICYKSNEDPQDNCPLLWRAFDHLDYLTVHAEDTPYLGGFNYLKTGFIKQPTDYYLRTLMLAVMSHMPRSDYYHTNCIGRHMTDELMFRYILDIVELAASNTAPVFVHSWLTSLAHHSYNNLQFGDNSIANFIHQLIKVSNDQTVFFFMSDHGQRYGPIRETQQGWYEDKLPTQWVYLPPSFRQKYPDWLSALKTNSARLTSHFDVYKTIVHMLKTFDTESVASKFYNDSSALAGQSLFVSVPENRTCQDAGVSVNFCACSQPKPLSVQDQLVVNAAKTAVKHLASLIPLDVCAEPILDKIASAAYLKLPSRRPVYLISLYTNPGSFLFEVNVELQEDDQTFIITTDLLRMNKITRAATCVTTPLLERYCYCK